MMLRVAVIPALLAVSAATAFNPALAADAPAAASTRGYTAADTSIGTLLDDPEAKAVIDKHMPGFSGNPQVEMARSMTLAQIQSFAPDQISADTIAKIDADLAKLPPKK